MQRFTQQKRRASTPHHARLTGERRRRGSLPIASYGDFGRLARFSSSLDYAADYGRSVE
jgi:hypothetical protein